MSISTKQGDDGTTSLWSGERVRKDDPRVEAYGTIDELNAFLSEALYSIERDDVRTALEVACEKLHTAAGMLASGTRDYPKPLTARDTEELTDLVHAYEAEVKLAGFVLLGRTLGAAKLDIARTVCRRAERRIAALDKVAPASPAVKSFVNRLSDLLFIAARAEELSRGKLAYRQ